MSIAPPVAKQAAAQPTLRSDALISRVPYSPGLDGMRAIAVVAVMIYHANATWLPGGFLGVEMFFVISGYLITLLLIAERERSSHVSLRHFWLRRARRLLPALFTTMLIVTAWTALFERDALGQLRGDVLAGTTYVSNWYQIWVGLGYTAQADFAPLRHLWSLAVEEQFYLVWPILMIVLLHRHGTRSIAAVSRWLVVAAVGITVLAALAVHPGTIGEPSTTPDAYWFVGGRAISKLDTLYLGTFWRAPALLLGAALAMVWRPYAVARGPLARRGRAFDVLAVAGLATFAWTCWNLHLVTDAGAADPRLFRGGMLLATVATLVLIVAVTHRAGRADRVLGNGLLVWIGTRSYGLYLYHWPIYQFMRKTAGTPLTVRQFATALAITVVVSEASYRFIEMPIRTGRFRAGVRRMRFHPSPRPRRILAMGAVLVAAVVLFAATTLVTAELKPNEVAADLHAGQDFVTDLAAAPSPPVGSTSAAASPGGDVGVDEPAADQPPAADAVVDLERSGAAADAAEEGATSGGRDAAADAAVPTTARSGPASTARSPGAGTVAGKRRQDGGGEGTGRAAGTVAPTTAPPGRARRPTQLGVVASLDAIQPLSVPPTDGGLPLIALGDSVMLGAAEELQAAGFAVDAVVSRQMVDFVPQMELMLRNGTFGSVVVVHLGTNGGFSQETLDRMMDTLADVPVVLVLTGKADRSWIAGNNVALRALPATRPNVTVLDWEALSAACPGDCFYEDGIHLTQAGQDYYAGLVKQLLGLA
jgi:peptidoglycan/LPS O-acetylase OafA/YrhL